MCNLAQTDRLTKKRLYIVVICCQTFENIGHKLVNAQADITRKLNDFSRCFIVVKVHISKSPITIDI